MSSFLDLKSSSNLGVSRQELPPGRKAESLSLDQRKNPITFTTPESTFARNFRKALLVACVIAFLISIYSYDPSHSRPASQGSFASVCFPTQSKCLLCLYLPNVLVNPPAIVFITSVLGFFTLVFVIHGLRRADIYQDQILAFGVVCGFILCGFLAFKGGGVSAFKNIMPGVIAATLATSAVLHTFLERWFNS